MSMAASCGDVVRCRRTDEAAQVGDDEVGVAAGETCFRPLEHLAAALVVDGMNPQQPAATS